MAFLVIGAVTVEVHVGGPGTEEHFEVGDAGRSFDGSYRSTMRGVYRRNWTGLSTPVLAIATADALLAELKHATMPRACSGDLTGSINCYVSGVQVVPVGMGAVHKEIVSFNLHEE